MPQIGFGVFQVDPAQTAASVRLALEAGYRHVDTARVYGNEAEVGEGIRRSGVPREDVFVTTKLYPDDYGRAKAVAALDESLQRLQTDYVDLFLLHWPQPPFERYLETWEALRGLRDGGSVRAIGVSNVGVGQLERLAAASDTVPEVNQVELHPWHAQVELRAYHAAQGIVTQAWRPIAKGTILAEPTIVRLAEAYGRTPAQVVLAWQVRLGNVVLPKSVTPSRIRENLDIFDFDLRAEDVAAISALDDDPDKPQSRIDEVLATRPAWTG
jgi:2,5-diketo-D-gluconate reductase A